jgi:putative membrane-bound dehydrogenase-like protein
MRFARRFLLALACSGPRMNWRRACIRLGVGLVIALDALGQGIPKPADAPPPLAPADAERSFVVPEGYVMLLVASEPLITEPTSVCWDERGRMYVGELHGYNLEGQLEIEEMNRSGVLDTKVQRVEAAEKFKEAAKAGTYGVVKRLFDEDGDGLMDKAQVLSSNLPPVYGLCPARGGLIVACQAEIIFLADRDDDGVAEVRETLFTGFKSGMLERGLNAPQWGPDGWIYVGRGWGAGEITGPYLKQPVHLPHTDFRIRPDGTAIEPVVGGTHTIGFTFTEDGDRFFTTTWKHALYAVPIEWRYWERNPNFAAPGLEADASDYTTVFPIAPVHPWKKSRSNDPGWKEFYARYGPAESVENGFFTSCASPLALRSLAHFHPGSRIRSLPAEPGLEDQQHLLVCEPAQSLIHQSIVKRSGPALRVQRVPGWERRELVASKDSWFRPVSLAEGPDGNIFIADMYREIIEDYSAVPRPMQQQYGLAGGRDRGRIWVLAPKPMMFFRGQPSPEDELKAWRMAILGRDAVWPPRNLSGLSESNLVQELDSEFIWHRQTAERLLRERYTEAHPVLVQRRGSLDDFTTPDEWPRTGDPSIFGTWSRVRSLRTSDMVRTLRSNDEQLRTNAAAAERLAEFTWRVDDGRVLLQLALSLGYSPEPEAFDTLAWLARQHARIRWMPEAILTGMDGRAGRMLAELLRDPGAHGAALFEPLAACIAARRDDAELASALAAIAQSESTPARAACLKGLSEVKPGTVADAVREPLARLLKDEHAGVRGLAETIAVRLKVSGAPDSTAAIRASAHADLMDSTAPTEKRLAALSLLATRRDRSAATDLLSAWPTSTPALRAAILDALLARRERASALVDALERKELPLSALNQSQRQLLRERADSHLRPRVEALFANDAAPDFEAQSARYIAALAGPRDTKRGGELFAQLCVTCHRVNGTGFEVGPDLRLAFQRAEETMIRDLLRPSDALTSSYETYVLHRRDGEELRGILVTESATSITLRMAGGKEERVLRRDLAKVESSPVSLMPEGFGDALTPADCANLLGWLREQFSRR